MKTLHGGGGFNKGERETMTNYTKAMGLISISTLVTTLILQNWPAVAAWVCVLIHIWGNERNHRLIERYKALLSDVESFYKGEFMALLKDVEKLYGGKA